MDYFLKLESGTVINVKNIESIERYGLNGIKINMVTGKSYDVNDYKYPVELINELNKMSCGEVDWVYI